jgi:hypothetical protein
MGLFPFTPTRKIPEEEISPPTPEQLQILLDTARPSLRRDSYFASAGVAELESTRLVTQVHGHGIFVCCCGHDNTLVHYEGKHPFGKLECGKCKHILCKRCQTTAIATPLTETDHARIAKMDLTKLRAIVDDLFQICPHCGLSFKAQIRCPDHRGERFCWVPVASHSHSELCSCQASAKPDWLKFVIGDPTAYRSDAAKALDDLKNIRIEKGLEKKYRVEHGDAVQKPLQDGWEGPGHRRAQVGRPQLQHTDSVAEFTARPFNNTHPDGRSQQEVAESHPIDLTVRNASMPHQPTRRPERLSLVQHSLKRSGAVRGNSTPRSGSNRSFRADPTATPRTGSYAESSPSARLHIRPRAGTWATTSEHQRLNERSDSNPSEGLLLHAQPASCFACNDGLYTPTRTDPPSSEMIMNAPQPSERSRSIPSSHCTISDYPGPSKTPSEAAWLLARRSVEDNSSHTVTVDSRALDRVKSFLGGTPVSAFFDLDLMDK